MIPLTWNQHTLNYRPVGPDTLVEVVWISDDMSEIRRFAAPASEVVWTGQDRVSFWRRAPEPEPEPEPDVYTFKGHYDRTLEEFYNCGATEDHEIPIQLQIKVLDRKVVAVELIPDG